MDRVVTSTQFQDCVIVITERGIIYRLVVDRLSLGVAVFKVAEIDLK